MEVDPNSFDPELKYARLYAVASASFGVISLCAGIIPMCGGITILGILITVSYFFVLLLFRK
jgi:hypothetical protein